MTYDERQDCEDDGGVWDDAKEVCSLDIDHNFGAVGTEEDLSTDTSRISPSLIILAGAVLCVPLLTAPLGLSLIIWGVGLYFFPDRRVATFLVAILLAIGATAGLVFLLSGFLESFTANLPNPSELLPGGV